MSNVIRQPLLMTVKAYPSVPYSLALSGQANKQLAIYSASAINGSGGAANVGLLRKFNTNKVKAMKYVDIGATYTDITSSLQAGTNVTVLQALNDALFLGSKDPAGLFAYSVQTAQVGGTFTYNYYNGTSFVTLNTFSNDGFAATGNKNFIFPSPVDWAQGGDANLDSSMYWVKIISTVASTTDAVLNGFFGAELLAWQEALADNGALEISSIGESKPLVIDAGEGLLPYFSTTNNLNLFKAAYNII